MTQTKHFISNNEADTIAFAGKCADAAKNTDIFTLSGPLGAGKSVFARAFIQHVMGYEIDVPSPTFTLIQTYDISEKQVLSHFDLYRTENPDEIYEIGWEEAISNGIILVEWPERLGHLMPAARKEIIIEPIDSESRKITLINHTGNTL